MDIWITMYTSLSIPIKYPSITGALSTRQNLLPLVSLDNHILEPSSIVHQAKLNSALSPTQNPRYIRTSPYDMRIAQCTPFPYTPRHIFSPRPAAR